MNEIKRSLRTIQKEGEKRLYEQKILEETEEMPLPPEDEQTAEEAGEEERGTLQDTDDQDGAEGEESQSENHGESPEDSIPQDTDTESPERTKPVATGSGGREIEDLVTLDNLPLEVITDQHSRWHEEYKEPAERVYLESRIEDILSIEENPLDIEADTEESQEEEPKKEFFIDED